MKQNKTKLYFTGDYTPSQPTFLRGWKLKANVQARNWELKRRKLNRYSFWKDWEQDSHSTELLQKQGNFLKKRNYSLHLKKQKKDEPIIRKDEPSMMITSNTKNGTSPRQAIEFLSQNLQGKMNSYLNRLIRRSEMDYNQKIQKIIEQKPEQKKNNTQNNFMRKMKLQFKRKARNTLYEGESSGRSVNLPPFEQ